MRVIILALTGALFVFTINAMAEPDVRYCKNLETGHVVTIVGSYPCPSGYVRVR